MIKLRDEITKPQIFQIKNEYKNNAQRYNNNEKIADNKLTFSKNAFME